ncbi:hypothetical protein M5K25_008292 [Dendrobium thyrsiflorum]|uniref:Uncharacterized protein n=1 Tax=Dendrobium thyrsiflorum TaxID=117978 RepID=A0ABD0VF41_DENTH
MKRVITKSPIFGVCGEPKNHLYALSKHGAVAEERYGDVITTLLEDLAAILGREGGAGGDWYALSNKGEATDEVVLAGEHVHRSALTTTAASGFPEELRHDGTGGNALTERVDVVAVGTDNGVACGEEPNEARGDRFLAIVEVDKAKHLAAVVHLGAHVLERAPQHHVFVQIQRFLGGNRLRKQKNTTIVRSDGEIGFAFTFPCGWPPQGIFAAIFVPGWSYFGWTMLSAGATRLLLGMSF